jgi:hypothetical protein
MKKISMIFLTVTLFLLLPLAVNARQGRSITFLLEGGKAWGSSVDGPFAATKIFLPLSGTIEVQAGYIHYFNPTEGEYTPNKRSGFTLGLQFKSRESGQRIQWFVHGDFGNFRNSYRWDINEFYYKNALGLGTGLEKLLSDRFGLRLNIRGWVTFNKDSIIGDAWAETSLGLFFRL